MRLTALAAAIGLAALPALAGEQYLDPTGFAVSGYDVTSYHDLAQAGIGAPQPAPEPGNAAITADWNGATWAFASEANREKFLADPAAFAPAYDGHCAFAVAKGGRAPGNPTLWRIVDGVLYLNVNERASELWHQDIPGNLRMSEANWPGIEPTPASDGPIPGFNSDAPVQ